MVTEQSKTQDLDLRSLQDKYRALSRMVQVSLVMNSTLRVKDLLDYIMRAANEITHSEAASILLVDKNTNQLRFAAATGEASERLVGVIVPIEGSIAGTIIAEDRAMIIDDAPHDPRHFQDVDEKTEFETKSILGVPMRIKDKLVGVLEVLNKKEGRFSEDDVRHITILASQAAVAIENAQLVAALRTAYEDLNKVNKLKNDFIAIASHELRTPLGMILGYASFLKDEAQGEAGEHADAVLNSALHLRNLIEDMTNLRYVQIDESELKIEVVSLHDILNPAYLDMQSLAEAKEQILLMEPTKHIIQVKADQPKIVMALTNVLNNAVKFTPHGGAITIKVEEQPKEAWIRVKDNGVGLETDQLERVFDQFYQVEDPMTRKQGGLGLGLSIAKAITERHGGRVWAESGGLGQGSVFTLALPLAYPKATAALDPKKIRGTGHLPELGL